MSTLSRKLALFGRPSEAAVASALLFLATAVPSDSTAVDSHTMFHLFALFCGDPDNPALDPILQQAVATGNPSPSEWRVDVLVQAVSAVATQFKAPLDWRLVIHSLDVEGLEKQLTQPAFVDIAKAYIAGTSGNLLPADCILDNWRHAPAQLCMVSHALSSPKCINWDVLEPFEGAAPEDTSTPYSRVALIEKLVELDARELLQAAVKDNAEVVLLSLTCAKPRRNASLQQKLTVTLLTPLIALFPSHERALRQMWRVTPALVEAGIINMWKKDPSTLRKALMIAIDMSIIADLLASGSSLEFSFELAMLAYQEDLLKFENWLMELLNARGMQSVSICTMYLAQKARTGSHVGSAQLSIDALRIVFRCLITSVRASPGSQKKELLDGVQDVYESYRSIDPRMVDLSPSNDVGDPKAIFGSDISSIPMLNNAAQKVLLHPPPKDDTFRSSEAASMAAAMLLPAQSDPEGTSAVFPPSIEKEADIYFGKLYKNEMPTEQAVDILRRLKSSNSEHDHLVFNCMVHTLFDEYRFFRKYPDRELKITGMLFGSVIQYSLLSGGLLGLSARCVLDALRTVEPSPQPVGSLSKFGLCALERFRSRLHEWPQYCSHILELPRLKELAPDLIGEVQKALDMNVSSIPSAAEKRIGLAVFDREASNEPILTADGGAPPASSVRDAAADADAVRALVTSPPLSTNNTPMKGRSISSTSIRSSPPIGVDGSLGMSPLDLPSLLGISSEEATQVIAPDEGTQDKVKFIFNNISQRMIDGKVEEMLAILTPENYRYFAVYIVVKRVPSEDNFHSLYVTMLEKMEPKVPLLFPMVYDTTYKRVKVLLAGDRTTASIDRTILKSLGSWIGCLTLARNIPILKRDLDLKEALMGAYSSGRLTTIIPFAVKVLEACSESKIFKPTNPWVRGIMSLMKEICAIEDIKLTMKFELQILSKHMGIDVNSIVPSELLSARTAPDRTDNPDFTTKKSSPSPPRTSPSPTASPSSEIRRSFIPSGVGGRSGAPMFSLAEARIGTSNVPPSVSAGSVSSARMEIPQNLVSSNHLPLMGADPVGDISSILGATTLTGTNVTSNQSQRNALHAAAAGSVAMGSAPQAGASLRSTTALNPNETLIPNLAQYITVSPSLMLFQSSPNLKRMIPIAIDRAIREIIKPVVERSCAIAFLTTKELTLKDFANEPDISKVRRAALQMVQQLAGSLALVTSKEPLRVSMGNQLRTILSPSVVGDQNLVEQTAQVVCAANLEVGCAVIERHAKEKAARELNEKIAPAFSSRRPQHSAYTYGMAPGPEVLRVYDEFSRIHRVGVLPPQYNAAVHAPVPQPQPVHPTHSSNQTGAPAMMSVLNQSSSRNVHGMSTARAPVMGTEHKVDGRIDGSQGALRPASISQAAVESSLHSVVGSRRLTIGVPTSNETSSATAVYGSPLPPLATPTSVAAMMLAVANSSQSGTPAHSQGMPLPGSSNSVPEEETLSTPQVLKRFNAIYPQIVSHITEIVASSESKTITLVDIPAEHEIHALWVQIPSAVKRSVTADEAGMAVAQKVFKRLYEGESDLYREVHVLLLEGIRESCRRLSKELGSWLAFSEERKKLHKECIIALLKPGSLLNKTSYDEVVAKAIDDGRSTVALEFACFLVKRALIEEPLATAVEFSLTLEAMAKVGRRPNPPSLSSAPEELLSLVERARSIVPKVALVSGPTTSNSDPHHPVASKPSKDVDPTDTAGAKESVAGLLIDWLRILASDSPNRPVPDHVVVSFLEQMHASVLCNEDSRDRFFRLTVQLVCAVTSSVLQSKTGSVAISLDLAEAPYSVVEATVRLVGALCRQDSTNELDGSSRGVGILCQFVSALVKDILKSSTGADLRPHFRLFAGLISELSVGASLKEQAGSESFGREPGSVSLACANRLHAIRSKCDSIQFLEDKTNGFIACVRSAGMGGRDGKAINLDNFQVLAALVGALSACAPTAVPGFSFSWLQLISNKELMPSLLSSSSVQGWPLFKNLLVSMLDFLSEFLSNVQGPLTKGIRTLYSGMLRVLLVLLHDFPEFLCAYHMAFCDAIPQNCVQLRNLVLASFPKDMRLPDPFLPELNVDDMPDMLRQPLILSNYTSPLEACGLKAVVDGYLQSGGSLRSGRPQLEIEKYVIVFDKVSGEKKYAVSTIGALVLYVGQFALSRTSHGEAPTMNCPGTDLLRSLTRELGPEGQHHLFNAIANQLRYPNNNTMYYSYLLLLMFHEASHDDVKEQITRVLVERLIANRPHPWGLLITFVQLIKNSKYNFWGHAFVRCAPEIEQLFENVAKFCVGPVFQNKHQSIAVATQG